MDKFYRFFFFIELYYHRKHKSSGNEHVYYQLFGKGNNKYAT